MNSGKYVCLLRGINVSGHKMVKMDRLRATFEALGCEEVKTYLQSGNVVFRTPKGFAGDLADLIQVKIEDEFGFLVPVLVLSEKEIEETLRQNPFIKEDGIDLVTLHVTFLSKTPRQAGVDKLAAISSQEDRFSVHKTLVYLHCPHGYGRTKLSNQVLEKKLEVEATTRNWKTVNELSRLLK